MTYNVRLSTRNLFKIPLVALLSYGIWLIKDFLLILFLALIISTFVEDFVVSGKRYRIPRGVSVALFYLVGIVLFGGTLFFILPVFGQEFLALIEASPALAESLNTASWSAQIEQFTNSGDIIGFARNLNLSSANFAPVMALFGGVFNVIILFIVSFYMSIHEGVFEKVLLLVSPHRYDKQVVNVWHRTQKKIGSWFRGQLIIALILVVLTYIGLTLMGIPYAFLLSLLAGLFGLVPYGIFLAIIPAIGLGFIHGGWVTGLLVLGLYLLIQQVLDYVLQPIILKKMTGIPSLVVILSVIFGAKLFGVIGLLIAVPSALLLIELVAEIKGSKAVNKRILDTE